MKQIRCSHGTDLGRLCFECIEGAYPAPDNMQDKIKILQKQILDKDEKIKALEIELEQYKK